METRDPNDGAGSPAMKAAARMGAMALAFYVVMHLAVAGVIRVVTGHDAADVIAPNGSTASVASPAPPTASVKTAPAGARGLPGYLAESADSPR